MITQKRLKEVLFYNPETGVFIWLEKPNPYASIKLGVQAGGDNGEGYWQININGESYYAHRLAWLYMEGYWPEHEVDHKNLIRDDNRWKNLRHVTTTCNNRNRPVFKSNTSGVTGVHWNKKDEKWMSKITVNKVRIYLGSFQSFNKAVKARWDAEVRYDFPNCNTTSSAYNYLTLKRILSSPTEG